MRRIVSIVCVALRLSAENPAPDFFPLQEGNQWILESRSRPNAILNVQVHRSMHLDGHTYYLLSGYAQGDVWVRGTPGGEIYARDMKTGAEEKLAHLSLDAAAYETALSGCLQETRPSPAEPEMPDHLVLTYAAGDCRDTGLSGEVYSPSLGLVRRTVTTLAGPETFTLKSARIGGTVYHADPKELVFHHTFSHGAAGWLGGFSDYSLVNGDMHFIAESRMLPSELDAAGWQGFFLQSMNRSDDMFMFIKRGLYLTDGLKPDQSYRLSFDIVFASNAQADCVGVGGAPGEGVYLKAGASADEPVSVAGPGKHLELNIDKGHQAEEGSDAGIVGNIVNGEPCDPSNARYVRVTKTYEHPRPVRTEDRAQLWLLVGTDSAYEGLTGLFYESVTVRLSEVEEDK